MPDQPSDDPAEHALDFALRYANELDYHAAQTMIDLGVPPEKIGDSDPVHGIRHAAFNPFEKDGGGISPDGRITIDSGVMNLDLLTSAYGDEAALAWNVGLRSRMQAIVTHERAEYEAGDHDSALNLAPETEQPISDEARAILRAMRDGWSRG